MYRLFCQPKNRADAFVLKNGGMVYLTIIPWVRMGSESIVHEAQGRMGYWLRGHEGERNNWFSKFQPVGQKYRDEKTLASKTRFSRHCFGF